MTTTLLLLRHAAHGDVGRVLTGRTPGAGLLAAGQAQAARLAARVAREAPAAVLTSPQQRARETAAAVGASAGLVPQVAAALDEIDFGEWAGGAFDTLRDDPRWQRWNAARGTARAPGGETMDEAGARAAEAMDAAWTAHPDGTVVLVTHADVIKAVVLRHLGLSMDAHARIDVAPGSITRLAVWHGGGCLLGLNEVVA